MALEYPPIRASAPGLRASLTSATVSAGLVAVIFAVTGPTALILTVAREGALTHGQLVSWIFGAFTVGGVLTILFSAIWRQPFALAWTIPGTAMLLTGLNTLSFAEAVGAFLVTGALMCALGLSGWIGRLTALVPVPVVMGMVAGVFLPIGLGVVEGFSGAPWIAGATIAGYIITRLIPLQMAGFPPILGALIAGVGAITVGGDFDPSALSQDLIAWPEVQPITFSLAGIAELVLPLLISVIAIQNLQGFIVLRHAGHTPPVNTLTVACGLGTFAMGAFGSVPCCVTGPTNGILVTADPPEKRWAGGIVFGVLMIVLGLFAPFAVSLANSVPGAFVAVLGALAMMPVLNAAFSAAFSGTDTLGALIAFIVTVSEITLLGVGSPFWGLVIGIAVWFALERKRKPA